MRPNRLLDRLMRTLACGVAGLCLLGAPGMAGAQPSSAGATLDQPGEYRFSLQHAGQERRYLVLVPPGIQPGKPLPLVLSFHGGGGHMEVQANDRLYGLVSHAARNGYAIVFPNGFSRLPSGKLATWNAGQCCGPAQQRNVDDVGFVRAVMADVEQRLTIDPHRVYAQGMSNGGMLAYRLACEMADTFAAIAAVAATDGAPDCQPSRPVPVLHIHAADDDHVPFSGGVGSASVSGVDYVSVPDTIAKWVGRNRCPTPSQRVLEVPGATCESHTPCEGGSEVRLCVTATGGHAWPGGNKRLGGRAGSAALNANDVIWAFFRQHARRP